MSFWENIGGFFTTVGQNIWEQVGEYGGAIGGAIGGWLGGQQGSQVGGQIGGGVQQLANPQTGYTSYSGYTGTPQPTYAKAGMCFIATECYSEYYKPVPQKFYNFRDRLPSPLVKFYYAISPKLIPIIRFTHSHKLVKRILNILVRG